ncbi:MAG: glycosyltransferase [SAR324 cluster bacterium]|nr:glycosyltransferase [SAR324 cluster bacterium]MBL7034905.1 glycosyltransferase [SAR324 cluster bacterium]
MTVNNDNYRNEQAVRVVFTGGGSGGPTIPLLALAEEIKLHKKKSKFLFLGSKDGPERKMVEQAMIPFAAIPSGKLRRYWSWSNLIDPFIIIAGFFAGLLHLKRFRPHIIVSAGSFVSVPVAFAAKLSGIPHVIFQMDVRPGLANRLMAPVSSALVYYFESTAAKFPSISVKQKIGPVVRKDIYNAEAVRAEKKIGLHPELPLILITGGGQGAAGLNNAVLPLLKDWLTEFQIVHLTGFGWEKNIEAELSCYSHPNYHQFKTVTEGMGDLLAKSEIVLTRAGMGILAELAVLQKDAILVPLPGTHQEENARLIQKKNAAEVVQQDILAAKGLEWWKIYWKQRIPGEIGKKLREFLQGNGTKDFAQLIFAITDDCK